jgi:hypothetical protein
LLASQASAHQATRASLFFHCAAVAIPPGLGASRLRDVLAALTPAAAAQTVDGLPHIVTARDLVHIYAVRSSAADWRKTLAVALDLAGLQHQQAARRRRTRRRIGGRAALACVRGIGAGYM